MPHSHHRPDEVAPLLPAHYGSTAVPAAWHGPPAAADVMNNNFGGKHRCCDTDTCDVAGCEGYAQHKCQGITAVLFCVAASDCPKAMCVRHTVIVPTRFGRQEFCAACKLANDQNYQRASLRICLLVAATAILLFAVISQLPAKVCCVTPREGCDPCE
jgi:hypothetical protein